MSRLPPFPPDPPPLPRPIPLEALPSRSAASVSHRPSGADRALVIIAQVLGGLALLFLVMIGAIVYAGYSFMGWASSELEHARERSALERIEEAREAQAFLAERKAREKEPVPDLEAALTLLEEGDEVDLGRVLLWAKAYDFGETIPDERHTQLGKSLRESGELESCALRHACEQVARDWHRKIESANKAEQRRVAERQITIQRQTTSRSARHEDTREEIRLVLPPPGKQLAEEIAARQKAELERKTAELRQLREQIQAQLHGR